VDARLSWSTTWESGGSFAAALIEGEAARVRDLTVRIARLPGPLVPVQAASGRELTGHAEAYCLNWLLEEVSTSVNTAAAGGNASLMTIG
jgi:RHH-type proline utilization regulon transcriptional repressor/proline dehydrogenase/delta 1-pyrroline-5-carboxylate dehydrogenase